MFFAGFAVTGNSGDRDMETVTSDTESWDQPSTVASVDWDKHFTTKTSAAASNMMNTVDWDPTPTVADVIPSGNFL